MTIFHAERVSRTLLTGPGSGTRVRDVQVISFPEGAVEEVDSSEKTEGLTEVIIES